MRGLVALGRAHDVLDPLLALVTSLDATASALPAGGVRRGEDLVDEVLLVVACHHPASVLDAIRAGFTDATLAPGSTDTLMLSIDRTPVTVACIDVHRAGIELLYRTGSVAHLEALQVRAGTRGQHLDRSGLRTSDNQVLGASEADIYGALGLPYMPPELRDSPSAMDRADRNALPRLVSVADIRGDLHCHTHWSDGRDSVDAMVRAAVALGYEYLAITDHSQNSGAVRNLTIDAVARQADEIAGVREAHPNITILHGCEVDILEDGTLDFPDRVLEQFDLVLASLHEPLGHAPEELHRRYECAMRHPLVTLVTHPTNRLVPHRPGYDLDYERVFELAVSTGTWLEIDGAPSHLDLDAVLARRAVGAGVTLSIDSDCHRADRLGRQMHLGLLTARRGWVEPRHVVNTLPIAGLRAAVQVKRTGRTPPGRAC